LKVKKTSDLIVGLGLSGWWPRAKASRHSDRGRGFVVAIPWRPVLVQNQVAQRGGVVVTGISRPSRNGTSGKRWTLL